MNADEILKRISEATALEKMMNPAWHIRNADGLLDCLGEEYETLEDLRQKVAQFKLGVYAGQDKKNVAAAQMAVEAADIFKKMRMQEHRCDTIESKIQTSKLNAKSQGGF